MKDVHFLFYITSKTYFVIYDAKLTLTYCKTQFCFDRAVSGQRSPQCTIARYYSTIVECCIYFISRYPVSSNQITRINIGVI